MWWKAPSWLKLLPSQWPKQSNLPLSHLMRNICLLTTVQPKSPIIPLDRYSNFTRLKRVTVWVFRFINNCCAKKPKQCNSEFPMPLFRSLSKPRTIGSQSHKQIIAKRKFILLPLTLYCLPKVACCHYPFLDSSSILRVGGRQQNSELSYPSLHPVILHGKHSVTKFIIRTEHLRLLHAGPTLLALLSFPYRQLLQDCSITHACTICCRNSAKPRPQVLGQLAIECTTPNSVFKKVGVDYAGPFYIKYGFIRKLTIVKAYVYVFVSLIIKASWCLMLLQKYSSLEMIP